MKTLISTLLIVCLTFVFSQEYIQTTTNSSYLNKNLRNTGRVIFGDDYTGTSSYQFLIYKNSLTDVSTVIGNSKSRLEFNISGGIAHFDPNSIAGDAVIKRLGDNKNTTFYMAYGMGSDPGPTSPLNFKYRFASDYSPYSLMVFASGKVTIGTKLYDDLDYRLFVKDGIKTEKVKVEVASTGGWADYVFQKDYQLMPLSHLRDFITENKHLPNMPSAEQVVDEGGFELKEMNVKLLEKVEELTLYILQQQKEIDSLREEVEKLK